MTEKSDKSRAQQAARQKKYAAAKKAAGLVKLSVYVPDSERDAFWSAIDKLREEWWRKGKMT